MCRSLVIMSKHYTRALVELIHLFRQLSLERHPRLEFFLSILKNK
jgi:hypothetical protein